MIDAQIISNNELRGELGKTIEVIPPKTQEKSCTPTTESQVIEYDEGYTGLSKVNVGAIPSEYIIPSGTETITQNGTYDITTKASVIVNTAGVDINDYFETSPEYIITSETEPWGYNFTKKAPTLTIPAGTSSLAFLFYQYKGVAPKVINDNDVTDMQYMFAGVQMNGKLDCSEIVTSNVNNLQYMFADCMADEIDATGIDFVYANNVRGMFMNCKNLKKLDISNFDIDGYVDASNMFNNAKNLAVIDASRFSFNKISYKSYMFTGCGTTCSQEDGAYADGIPYVYVKNATQQQWVLNQGNPPSRWSTNNVVIKS